MPNRVAETVALVLQDAGVNLDQTVLLTISGGRDSVVLAHVLQEIGQSFALAHVNYQLRAEDSAADEAFVRQLARDWSVPCHVKQVQPATLQGNVQQEARKLRYAWAESLCEAYAYPFYLCAHHQRDQVESFLLALIKGRGSRALAAMPVRKGRRLRPCLSIASETIQAYAEANQLRWRHDRSNDSLDYDRNFIRNAILPPLSDRFPKGEELIAREINRIQMQEALLDSWMNQHQAQWIEVVDDAFHRWDLSTLKEAPWLEWVVGRLASTYGWSQSAIDALWQLWHAAAGKRMQAGGWTVVRTRLGFDWFVLPPKRDFSLPITSEGTYELPDGSFLEVRLADQPNQSAAFCLACNHDDLAVSLRYWQNGDKIAVARLGHKKVSDLMQSWQWNYRQRYLATVLLQDTQVVWVVGSRSRTFAAPSTHAVKWWVFTIKHD